MQLSPRCYLSKCCVVVLVHVTEVVV